MQRHVDPRLTSTLHPHHAHHHPHHIHRIAHNIRGRAHHVRRRTHNIHDAAQHIRSRAHWIRKAAQRIRRVAQGDDDARLKCRGRRASNPADRAWDSGRRARVSKRPTSLDESGDYTGTTSRQRCGRWVAPRSITHDTTIDDGWTCDGRWVALTHAMGGCAATDG